MDVAVDAINAISPGGAPSGTGGSDDKFIRDNSEFEKQSQMGRATGYLKSSPELREAITEFYESQHQKEQNKPAQTPDDVLG